jgi:hypothetical protein
VSAQTFLLEGPLEVSDVPHVRRFVEHVHRHRVSDRDDIARVAMTAHELLENAIKFSSDGAAALSIDLADSTISIKTRNRARTEDLVDLRRIASELAEAEPMAFYLDQMARNPKRIGGLGLGRIAAEGDMTLSFLLDGEMVEVVATSRISGRAG